MRLFWLISQDAYSEKLKKELKKLQLVRLFLPIPAHSLESKYHYKVT